MKNTFLISSALLWAFFMSISISTYANGLAFANSNPGKKVTKTFRLSKQGSAVMLYWNESTDKQFQRFEVQRSANGTNWEVIAVVFGQANKSAFKAVDVIPQEDGNYYRIKKIEQSGKCSFTRILFNETSLDQGLEMRQLSPALSDNL